MNRDMDFLELIETMRAEDASAQRLYAGEGRSLRSVAHAPDYKVRLAEAIDFIDGVFSGKIPAYRFKEAINSSDFTYLFADVIDRQMLANYAATVPSWEAWAKRNTVRDFRTVRRFTVSGSEAVLASVDPQAPYPESTLSDAKYEYAVGKYGRKMAFAWESYINDDLGALKDIPERFAKAARRSEEKFATQLIADANGPHASFFTSGNKNQIVVANGAKSANPVLGIQGIADALTVLSRQVDADGEPIEIEMAILVVPPALEVPALNILNATELWNTEAGGSSNQQLHVQNWMRNKVKLAVDSYLPIISTTNGHTAWYVFASPANGRPAVEIGFLRGHEQPEIFMKEPDAIRVGGGGSTDAENGDFDADETAYKVRHVFGGTRMDPKMAVASNGSGS